MNTKDVVVNDVSYQLTRFSARDGSWVVGQFLLHNLLASLDAEREVTEKDLGIGLAATLGLLPEAVCNRIQTLALAAVRRYELVGEQTVPKPLTMADGRLIFDLDLVELTALSVAALVFNLHCFFSPGARKTLLTVFPDPSSLPGLTATSSPR